MTTTSINGSAFSPEQIAKYLKYVELPQQWHPSSKPKLDLDFLTILHIHQISTIPYENLSLHYSKDKKVILEPQFLYDKFIGQHRGGYCMETSIFYNHILRALGFQVYTAGVRIRLRDQGTPYGNFVGWIHIVNIVKLANGIEYMVDVGFGGDGATRPLPLIDGHVQHNLGTQEIRLIHSTIPEQADQTKPLWVYQYRNAQDKPWNSYYAFPEAEFTEADFDILNYWASTCPNSFQTFTILVIKFLRTNDRISGKVMMWNELVKRNLGGKTELVQTLRDEPERVEALEKWFGLRLTKEQIEGIKGHKSEIRS